MAQLGAENRPEAARVRVHPVHATVWKWDGKRPARERIDEPAGNGLEDLEKASEENVVWIEARLDGLKAGGEAEEWLTGSLEAWDSIDKIPQADWGEMSDVLRAVDAPVPEGPAARSERVRKKLLRAIPYLYVQGAFATRRDVRSNGEPANEFEGMFAFPLVGFNPNDSDNGATNVSYTMVRTMVGVIGEVVVTVRLPDTLWAESDEGASQTDSDIDQLFVPDRFFPFLKDPSGLDVATAIGIHQASTARSVVKRIRKQLTAADELAEKLNALQEGDLGRKESDADLREAVVAARAQLSQLSEITHKLDQQIARIMRRFGGSLADAQPLQRDDEGLIPEEVRLRYKFALDDVRQLRDDCEITTERVGQALTGYERDKRERLEHLATVLGACLLIPTLVASILGVNFGIPDHENRSVFIGFLVAISLWGGLAYWALRNARNRELHMPTWERIAFVAGGFAVAGAGVVAGFVASSLWPT